jgi:hypothetical protein
VFSWERWDDCPCDLIVITLQAIHDRDKAAATAQSWAVARVGALLSGESEQVFLPFPNITNRISKRTAKVFMKLVHEGRLSPRIFGICGPLMADINKALRS